MLIISSQVTSLQISDSALLIEEEQEWQEAIEDIQAVVTSNLAREEAGQCLEEVGETRAGAGGGGGFLYWTLMSKTFLKKLLPSHKDENDVVCE